MPLPDRAAAQGVRVRGRAGRDGGLRFERGTAEFGRVVNLSDAVFAIAMTLLVLTLDVPAPGEPLADALVARLPQLVAFVLAFALVANIWWAQHKLVARLASLDRGLVALTLALLGAVALVPYPTALIGNAPAEQAAVVPFIGLFVIILVLFLLLYLQAQRARAWRSQVPGRVFNWLLVYWVLSIAGMSIAPKLVPILPPAPALMLVPFE